MAYINCKDGFEFSITWGRYSLYSEVEKKDGLTYPKSVEVRENSMADDKRDPVLEEYISECDDRIAPYVPIDVIHDLIDRHGGIDHRAYTFLHLVRNSLDK